LVIYKFWAVCQIFYSQIPVYIANLLFLYLHISMGFIQATIKKLDKEREKWGRLWQK
jgi:hypothetical protein